MSDNMDWYYDEYDFDEEHEELLTPQNSFWTTRDGRRIKISDMETRHIVNTMKMIIRNSDIESNAEDYLNLFIDELSNRAYYAGEKQLKILREEGWG